MTIKNKIIKQTEKIVVSETSQRINNAIEKNTKEALDPNMAFKKETKTKLYTRIEKKKEYFEHPKTQEKIDKARILVKKASVRAEEDPFNDARVNNFIIDGISHDKHLIPHNRFFEKKDKLVTKLETETKILIETGKNRIEEPKKYEQEVKTSIQKMYDPNNLDNGEFRGVGQNMRNQIIQYNYISHGDLSAERITRTLRSGNPKVTLHSKFLEENENSYTNAVELLAAEQFSNVTGYEIFVTADSDLSDKEVKAFIGDSKFISPEYTDQKCFDLLIARKVDGQRIVECADCKLKSLNATFSKMTINRDIKTTASEIWPVGSATYETQQEVHKKISENALLIVESQPKPLTESFERKKNAISKYEISKNPKDLDDAPFVAKIIFNNDLNLF